MLMMTFLLVWRAIILFPFHCTSYTLLELYNHLRVSPQECFYKGKGFFFKLLASLWHIKVFTASGS